MKQRIAQLACLLLATLAAVQQGLAQPGRGPQQEDAARNPREAREEASPAAVPRNGLFNAPAQTSAPAISSREASDLAREAFEGRVIRVSPDGDQWRIRMDDDGTVFSVLVDANSGAVARDAE